MQNFLAIFLFRYNKQLLKIMQVAPWPKCSETNNIIVTYSDVTFKLIISLKYWPLALFYIRVPFKRKPNLS